MNLTVAAAFVTALARLTRSLAAQERDQAERQEVSYGCFSDALASAVLGDGARVIAALARWLDDNEASRDSGTNNGNDRGPNAERLRGTVARYFARAIADSANGLEVGANAAEGLIRAVEACDSAEAADDAAFLASTRASERTAQDTQAAKAERRQREHAESLAEALANPLDAD